jgi:hypothetical protein
MIDKLNKFVPKTKGEWDLVYTQESRAWRRPS